MLGVGRIGGVAGALVGAALMGLGWQFGSVFSLLAVPAMIAAAGVFVVAGRVRASGVEAVELTPAVE
jgi:AAHS family 4-hydroxybenzoate transporter-like MFS transporter